MNMHYFNQRPLRVVRAATTALVASLAVAACSSDIATPPGNFLAPNGEQSPTTADSGTRPTGGAVAGVRISQRRISLAVNGTAGLAVYPVDANGIPSLAQLAGKPAWAVANPAVAAFSGADGVLRGISLGTTKVYATWGSYKDSAVVDVVATRDTVIVRDSSGTGGTPSTPSVPVASFTLTTYVFGRAAPANPNDSAMVVRMGGATLSVYKLSASQTSPSDSLGVRTLVKTGTADAMGKAVFTGLNSGFYTVIATATYQGASLEGRMDFGPPPVVDFQTSMYLSRKQ